MAEWEEHWASNQSTWFLALVTPFLVVWNLVRYLVSGVLYSSPHPKNKKQYIQPCWYSLFFSLLTANVSKIALSYWLHVSTTSLLLNLVPWLLFLSLSHHKTPCLLKVFFISLEDHWSLAPVSLLILPPLLIHLISFKHSTKTVEHLSYASHYAKC